MYPFGDTSAKKREVRLGEPTLAYSRLYDYRDNMSSELLVPALVFPVLDTPKDGEWFNTQVVVPLVKDFFEVPGGNPAVPFPLPALPMAR